MPLLSTESKQGMEPLSTLSTALMMSKLNDTSNELAWMLEEMETHHIPLTDAGRKQAEKALARYIRFYESYPR